MTKLWTIFGSIVGGLAIAVIAIRLTGDQVCAHECAHDYRSACGVVGPIPGST
jgi:hypothetical protein